MAHEDFLSSLDKNLTLNPIDDLKNEKFVLGISCGEIKFLEVVESIQGALTNENVNVRGKAIEFLSWILSKSPTDLFNRGEIIVIVNFYCDCLKGHHSIVPATIVGLNALIKMNKITKEEILKILTQLFQNVNCQTQLQPDRYNIFSLLKYVIENFIEEIKAMGPDFVFGLISFMEGESDPSCLLLLFNFLPFFLKNFDLGHLSEEMFEILSCYFPIDFNAAAKENVVIGREDLALGLINCLSANSTFSELCLPMILEKLDSTLKTAKLDSYKLLEECCKGLKLENVKDNLNELWKHLQKDILPGTDGTVCQAGLNALTELVNLLSKDSNRETLYVFLNDILTTVQSLINRADENMFHSVVRVLLAASILSKPAAVKILCHLKPYYQLDSEKTLMEKKVMLSSFLPFVKICLKYNLDESQEKEIVSSYLDLVNLYLSCTASDDVEVRKLAFAGLSELFPKLDVEYKRKLFNIMIENIEVKEDIRMSEEFIKTWRKVAENEKPAFHSDILQWVTTSLKRPHASRCLWALSLLAYYPGLNEFVISTLLTVIESSENYVSSLESLLNACRFMKESTDFLYAAHNDYQIIERLINWVGGNESNERQVVTLVSEILALVIRSQKFGVQQGIVDKYAKIFCEAESSEFRMPLEQAQNVFILEAIFGSLKPGVKIPMISSFREKLTDLALKSPDEYVRVSSSRLLASLVNKSSESDFWDEITKDVFGQLDKATDFTVKKNSAVLFTWLVKGAMLGGAPYSENLISLWFDILGRPDIGEVIAEEFQTVLREDELYLNLDSHCIVKVLYRQRLFKHFPKLLKMYEASEGTVRMNYLLALVRLLQGVPLHLVQTEISKVVTLLIRCLDAGRADVLTTSLEILKAFLEKKEKMFSDHCHSFIPRFLKLAKFEGQMKIRLNALKCLYLSGFYPTAVLLPMKHQVIRELESCLDDKKRLVRKEAAKARCRWFLVGAPGEDILDSL